VGGIGFGYGVAVGGGWYGHNWHADWHDHHMHDGHGGGTWHHDPGHRGGVAYPDDRTRQRFGGYDYGNREARRDFRGFDMRPGNAPSRGAAQSLAREPAQRSTPSLPRSALDPQRHDVSRAQSERGHSSLGGTAHPLSRPSAPPASHGSAPAHSGGASHGGTHR
jgi:hypothetical protein